MTTLLGLLLLLVAVLTMVMWFRCLATLHEYIPPDLAADLDKIRALWQMQSDVDLPGVPEVES